MVQQLAYWIQTIDWNIVASLCSAVSVIVAACVAVWGINAWRREFNYKRKAELAEEALGALHAVTDAIAYIRSLRRAGEGSTRKIAENETPKETELLNQAYIVYERYRNKEDVFLRFRTVKYRFMASFGKETENIFNVVEHILKKIFIASDNAHQIEQELLDQGQRMGTDKYSKLLDEQKKYESEYSVNVLCGDKDNAIKLQLDEVLSKLEKVTGPYLGRYYGNT